MTLGQLSFEGKEITGVEVDVPGLGVVNVGELGLDEVPQEGDRLQVNLELVLGRPSIGSKKPDAHTGFATTPAIRSHKAFIVGNTVKVTGFLKASDVEALWQREHGAETA